MSLRHIVLFGFKPEVGEVEAAEVVRRFEALREAVPGVEGFECGVNCSPEGLNNGLPIVSCSPSRRRKRGTPI